MIVSVKTILAIHERQCAIFYCHLPTDSAVEPIIFTLVITNHIFADFLFTPPASKSLLKTTYFTITTMATLGASGYEPNTDAGYIFVIINVLTGISIFSATINSIFKKVIR